MSVNRYLDRSITNKEIVLTKLAEVPERDWVVVADKCRRHIKTKIKWNTLYGAHAISNLGMPVEQYYFEKAVEKLYNPEGGWEWKFEKFTLTQQLFRIIDSLISEEVRKISTAKAKAKAEALKIEYTDSDLLLDNISILSYEDLEEREQQIQDFVKLVEEAIQGNDKLELLYLHLMDGRTYDEIVVEMQLASKEQLYKLVESLKEKVQKHAASKNSKEKKS